jgi:hypothetical protein
LLNTLASYLWVSPLSFARHQADSALLDDSDPLENASVSDNDELDDLRDENSLEDDNETEATALDDSLDPEKEPAAQGEADELDEHEPVAAEQYEDAVDESGLEEAQHVPSTEEEDESVHEIDPPQKDAGVNGHTETDSAFPSFRLMTLLIFLSRPR